MSRGDKRSVLLTSRATIGSCAINTIPMATNQGFQSIIPNSENNNLFMLYAMQFHSNRLLRLAYGTTFLEISKSHIRNVRFPCPPLREQQKIASILSKVDELIQKTDQVIEQTQRLKKGLVQRLLTKGIGHKRFKTLKLYNDSITIPEQWTVAKLKNYTTKLGSGITPTGGRQVYVKKGIPLIRSQNVHFDGLKLDDVAYITQIIHDEMKSTKLQDNDVLLNITGASLGRCTFIPANFGEGNVNQHVCIIRPKTNLNAIFLSYFLSSYVGQKMIFRSPNGLSREGLNFKEIGSFQILIPSLQEQEKIVSIISKIIHVLGRHQRRSVSLENLKKGLMQKLLTGKIRVKV
jgi:type I restriction enzyme S subunit